jgi:hypothetical protein
MTELEGALSRLMMVSIMWHMGSRGKLEERQIEIESNAEKNFVH